MQVEVKIPFDGFYETTWSRIAWRYYFNENECKCTPEQRETTCCADENCDPADPKWDLKPYEIEVCKDYVEQLSKAIGIKMEFKDMVSPREYNFSTDRIFAMIDRDDLNNIMEAVGNEKMAEYVKKHFTSYDGFSSFYSNDFMDWINQEDAWDHNQWGSVLEVYIGMHLDAGWQEDIELGMWDNV